MGQSMVGRLAIRAKQIKPGDAFAAVVPAGGLIEIVDLEGRQVAELVAFDHADPSEHLSLGVTRHQSKSIMLSLGMKLYSSRGRTMLDLVEDTVGRHDLLWAAPTGPVEVVTGDIGATTYSETAMPDVASAGEDSETGEAVLADAEATPDETVTTTEAAGNGDGDIVTAAYPESDPDQGDGADADRDDLTATPSTEDHTEGGIENGAKPDPLTGFPAALEPFGLSDIDAPDPVNFFMQLAVMQRGDLELREPLSDRGDRVVLQALTELIVAVRCSAADDETNGEQPSDILVRIYR